MGRTLNSNEMYAALSNLIISQEVFANPIKGANMSLVEQARVDGGLYGDTKQYVDADILKSHPWGPSATYNGATDPKRIVEAANLLATDYADDPEVQYITIDNFRQIRLTTEAYLSKRAWGDEGAFSAFQSVLMAMMRDTKKVYEQGIYNSYIGTTVSSANRAVVNVDVTTAVGSTTGEEKNRLEAQAIAQGLADLLVDMKDISRDFNDYKHMKSYEDAEIKFIWSSKVVNKISKIDLPTIFHNEGLINKFSQEVLPSRFFGHILAASEIGESKTYTGTVKSGQKIYVLDECDVTVDGGTVHLFPSEALPVGATYTAGTVFVADDDVICKVVVKLPALMSAFEVGSSFYNARALIENHYLTWGFNDLEYFKAFPFITVKAI